MISLFDHLVAVLISSVVVMMLFSVQMRAQNASIQRTLMYEAKNQMLSLADVVERDLSNLGYDRNPTHESRILNIETLRTSSLSNISTDVTVTKAFEFWGARENAAGNTEPVPIRYRLDTTGTAVVNGVRRALFRVERDVCASSVVPCTNWTKTAESTSTLTDFKISLISDGGAPIENVGALGTDELNARARNLRLKIWNAVAPKVDSEFRFLNGHRQLFWSAELRPKGLRKIGGASS